MVDKSYSPFIMALIENNLVWKKKAYCLQFYKDIEWGKCYSSKLASHIVFHSVCYVQIEWMLWNYEACSSWMGHFAISDIVYRKIVHTYSVMKNKQIDIIQYKKKNCRLQRKNTYTAHITFVSFCSMYAEPRAWLMTPALRTTKTRTPPEIR